MNLRGGVDRGGVRSRQKSDRNQLTKDLCNYICYSCYTQESFAPDSTPSLRDFGKLFHNYEVLRPKRKGRGFPVSSKRLFGISCHRRKPKHHQRMVWGNDSKVLSNHFEYEGEQHIGEKKERGHQTIESRNLLGFR